MEWRDDRIKERKEEIKRNIGREKWWKKEEDWRIEMDIDIKKIGILKIVKRIMKRLGKLIIEGIGKEESGKEEDGILIKGLKNLLW